MSIKAAAESLYPFLTNIVQTSNNIKDWPDKKVTIYSPIFYLVKSSENFFFLPAFYLIMWLMKDPKNFEKIAILKI